MLDAAGGQQQGASFLELAKGNLIVDLRRQVLVDDYPVADINPRHFQG
ncbi:MAG: hypothetical protein ND866_16350 [Pyrinomonadaceae bacterium]|nr:hypothetical protein [Pyrinomonadaceae bacterium]